MKPDDCPLCQGSEGLRLAAWGHWDPGLTKSVASGQRPGGQWTAAIGELLAKEGLPELSDQEIAIHFHRHRPVQPAARKGIPRGQAIYGLQALGPELEAVVTAVFRLHKMTTEQIQEAFFPDKNLYQVADLLNYAAQAHYLYRFYLDPAELKKRKGLVDVLGERLTLASTLWYLGRAGAVYVQEKLGLDYKVSYTRSPEQTSAATLAHDLKCARLGIALQRGLRQQPVIEYQQQPAQVSFNPRNWLGPTTQGLIMGYWHRPEIRWAQIMPDGMLGINVEQSALGTGGTVLFVEYDHGSKDHQEVVDQLWAYNALGESGAAGARFPELQDWTIPAIMIFSSRQRMENIIARFRAELGRQEPYIPLWFAAEEDWLSDPLGPIIGNCWSGEQGLRLLDLWLPASEKIIPRIAEQQLLAINQRGAPVRNEKGQKYSGAPGQNKQEMNPEQKEPQQQAEAVGHNPEVGPDEPDFSAPRPAGNAQAVGPEPQRAEQAGAADPGSPQPQVGDQTSEVAEQQQVEQQQGEQDKQDKQPQHPEQKKHSSQPGQPKQPQHPDQHEQQAGSGKKKNNKKSKKKKKKPAIKAAPEVLEAQRWSAELVATYQRLAALQAQGQQLLSGGATIEDLPPVAGAPAESSTQPAGKEQPTQQPGEAVSSPEATLPPPAPLPGETELPPPVDSEQLTATPVTPPPVVPDQPPVTAVGDDFPELAPGVAAPKSPTTNPPKPGAADPGGGDYQQGVPAAGPGEDIEELLSRQADQARQGQ